MNIYIVLIVITVLLLLLVVLLGLYQKTLINSDTDISSKKEEEPEIIKTNTVEDTDEII